MSTILYQMVANNATYNGKFRTCCTVAKLDHFATGCMSELKQQFKFHMIWYRQLGTQGSYGPLKTMNVLLFYFQNSRPWLESS